MAKIHRSQGQRISPFTAARRKNQSLWDQLELLIIPGVLAAGAFFVHDQVAQKQKSNPSVSLAEQAPVFVQPSNQSVQPSINQDLSEAEQINGDQVLLQTRSDSEIFWFDRPVRRQVRKSLSRADLIRSNETSVSFTEINPSSETNLLSIKSSKSELSSPLEAALLQKLAFKTQQAFPQALFIDNNTSVNLSGVDLFRNHLTNANLFEAKLIKADFRRASFSKASLIDQGFPGVNLLGTDPLATGLLSIDLNKTDFLSSDPATIRRSEAKLIKIPPLGFNLSKIGFIEADFGKTAPDDAPSSKGNSLKTVSGGEDLNKPEPVTENLGATDLSEPSHMPTSPGEPSQTPTSPNAPEIGDDISVIGSP